MNTRALSRALCYVELCILLGLPIHTNGDLYLDGLPVTCDVCKKFQLERR